MRSIPIYLVVGALGSGKTTLLKRLVNTVDGRSFIYVINELSAIDVDSALIEKEGGVVVALYGGSLFRQSLRSKFAAKMRGIVESAVAEDERTLPDAVVIEVSALADPRSMNKLLCEKGLDQNYHLAGVTAIVNPGLLMRLWLLLPHIRGQIQCADLILFNKIDLHATEMVDLVLDWVRSINNSAEVIYCTHCDVDPALILREIWEKLFFIPRRDAECAEEECGSDALQPKWINPYERGKKI